MSKQVSGANDVVEMAGSSAAQLTEMSVAERPPRGPPKPSKGFRCEVQAMPWVDVEEAAHRAVTRQVIIALFEEEYVLPKVIKTQRVLEQARSPAAPLTM